MYPRGVRRAHSHNARDRAARRLALLPQPKAPVLESARHVQADASDETSASMPNANTVTHRMFFIVIFPTSNCLR